LELDSVIHGLSHQGLSWKCLFHNYSWYTTVGVQLQTEHAAWNFCCRSVQLC